MRKYLLLAGAALIGFSGSAYAAINCAVPPTCEELGFAYSSAECDGQSTLKCPFDQTKLYCTEPGGKQAAAVTCTIGSVLYNDLKCYDEAPSGKTAIAVVFDTSKRLAIALDQQGSIEWGGYGRDISGLDNCTITEHTSCGTDGKSNTQKIVAALGESSDYAAGLCYTLTIGGLAKGGWFLPSMIELKTLYNNKTAVNAGLTKAGGITISTSGYYWSSTESSSNYALSLYLSDGDVLYDLKYSSLSITYARCAVKY